MKSYIIFFPSVRCIDCCKPLHVFLAAAAALGLRYPAGLPALHDGALRELRRAAATRAAAGLPRAGRGERAGAVHGDAGGPRERE